MSTKRPSRRAPTDEIAAFDVVRYLREHGGYGGSSSRALHALKRRPPETPAARLASLLGERERLLVAAKGLAKNSEAQLFKGWDPKRMMLDLGGLDEQLANTFPSRERRTGALALQWVFYWHYLR